MLYEIVTALPKLLFELIMQKVTDILNVLVSQHFIYHARKFYSRSWHTIIYHINQNKTTTLPS